jgi:hypothetical protein
MVCPITPMAYAKESLRTYANNNQQSPSRR